ncbi:MAG: creatininase family protein [Candidatus Eisenbacteria bacterium]
MSARLEDLTWIEAERLLTEDAVVVLPIGAAAKEHGPHLRLDNDWTLAEALVQRVMARTEIVVAPTLGYHFYPAFVEYPGSTSLRLETARDLVVDVCTSLARFGPRRFYALNTGVSTVRALTPAGEELARDGIRFRFTDILAILGPVEAEVCEQDGGTHADESETSMMLHLAPDRVAMDLAVRDYDPKPGLTRIPGTDKGYSPSGVFGDPTLATEGKGRRLVQALVDGIVAEIEGLRRSR